jgi:transcriptional regulator with XRE-family HTH domain
MTPEEHLKDAVKVFRKSHKLSQTNFGKLVGREFTQVVISRIEIGVRRIHLDDAVKLSKVLKIKLDEL